MVLSVADVQKKYKQIVQEPDDWKGSLSGG